MANFHLGQAHHASGNYSQAIGAFRANVELNIGELLDEPVDPAGPDSIVIALTLLAWCQAECGDFALAIESGETAVRTACCVTTTAAMARSHSGLTTRRVMLDGGPNGRRHPVLELGLSPTANAFPELITPAPSPPVGGRCTRHEALGPAIRCQGVRAATCRQQPPQLGRRAGADHPAALRRRAGTDVKVRRHPVRRG